MVSYFHHLNLILLNDHLPNCMILSFSPYGYYGYAYDAMRYYGKQRVFDLKQLSGIFFSLTRIFYDLTKSTNRMPFDN